MTPLEKLINFKDRIDLCYGKMDQDLKQILRHYRNPRLARNVLEKIHETAKDLEVVKISFNFHSSSNTSLTTIMEGK